MFASIIVVGLGLVGNHWEFEASFFVIKWVVGWLGYIGNTNYPCFMGNIMPRWFLKSLGK